MMGIRARFVPAGGFAESVLTVATGTVIAQTILLLGAPLLTRLYSPEDFGVFALYLSLTGIISRVATAGYALAVMLPERDEEACNVVALSILIAVGVSLLTLLSVWLFNGPITRLLGNSQVSRWLYFAPLTVLLGGVFQTLGHWSLRRKQFRDLAVQKVNYSGGMTASQIGLGRLGVQPGGLFFGQIAGYAVATGLFARKVHREDWGRFKGCLARPVLRGMLRRYSDFPKYDTPSSLLNTLSHQMPTLLFSVHYGPAAAGFYALTDRVLSMPVSLIAESVRAAFKQRAASDYAKSGNCRGIYLKTLACLAVLALPPFAALAVLAPPLFALAFGEKWRAAGEFARILAGLHCAQFIASPLSSMLFIAEKQRLNLLWQTSLFLSASAALMLGVLWGSAKASLIAFAAVYVLLYLVSLGISYRLALGSRRC